MKKMEASLIKSLVRISWHAWSSVRFGQCKLGQFIFGALSLFSLSLSLLDTRISLRHSSFGARKEKHTKGKEGKQGSREEEKDQAASAGILSNNIFHV